MSDESSTPLIDLIKSQFPNDVSDSHNFRGDQTVTVLPAKIVDVIKFLRDDERTKMTMLSDLTAVDYMGEKPRFEVVYHLKSLAHGARIRIKARIAEDNCQIDSIHDLFHCANWLERECYDMYGIQFTNHPDLRRLLMWEGFEGYPLRKDYPVDRQQPLVEMRDIEERYDYERS